MRLYTDLAEWWPLLSPPPEYIAEVDDLVPRVLRASASKPETLLELGCGGGSMAFHLKRHFRLTLTDISPAMLAQSRAVNRECEHILGDMRALRMDRQFDVVMIHDAIMYQTDAQSARAALDTAARHCRRGGVVAVLPDFVKETFEPGTEWGGEDGADGRGLRYLEWRWDPDPQDDTYVVDYAFLLRASDGSTTVDHDRHVEGLFRRAQWLDWFAAAGIPATSSLDPWHRDVFIGVRA